MDTPRPHRWWATLGVRLFLSYLAVLAVALGVLWVAVHVVAPPVFDAHLGRMMAAAPFGPMGASASGQGRGIGMPMDAVFQADLGATFQASLGQALLLASAGAILAALVASVLVTRRLVLPVQQLVNASQRLAAGHYDERVPGGSEEELSALAA